MLLDAWVGRSFRNANQATVAVAISVHVSPKLRAGRRSSPSARSVRYRCALIPRQPHTRRSKRGGPQFP